MSWEMETKKEREIYLRRAIVELLCKSAGLRKRTIASYVGASVMEVMGLLHRMCEEGILRKEYVNDFGNMDYYEKYYVKG